MKKECVQIRGTYRLCSSGYTDPGDEPPRRQLSVHKAEGAYPPVSLTNYRFFKMAQCSSLELQAVATNRLIFSCLIFEYSDRY